MHFLDIFSLDMSQINGAVPYQLSYQANPVQARQA